MALGSSADALLFDDAERGPDEALRMQFEAVSRFEPDDKRVVQEIIERRCQPAVGPPGRKAAG